MLQTTFGEKQMPSDVHYTRDAWEDVRWDREDHHGWSYDDAYYGAEEGDDWHDAYDDEVYYGHDDQKVWCDTKGWTDQAHDVDE